MDRPARLAYSLEVWSRILVGSAGLTCFCLLTRGMLSPYSRYPTTNHAIFRTLTHLEVEASSKACWTCKIIRHIQIPAIVRTVYSRISKDILGFLGIVRDIDAYSATLTGAQLVRGGRPPLSFFGNLEEPEAYSNSCETLTRHIQNPVIFKILL